MNYSCAQTGPFSSACKCAVQVLFCALCSLLRLQHVLKQTFKHDWLHGFIMHVHIHLFFLSLFIRSVLQNIQRQKSDNMFLTIIHLYVPQLVTAALLCLACWFVFKKKAVVMYVDAEHLKVSKGWNVKWRWISVENEAIYILFQNTQNTVKDITK